MNTWHSVDLGDGVDAFAPTRKIQEAFFALAVANKEKVANLAVFSRYDLESNIVTAYFSPGTSSIAKLFNATPCEKPSGDGIKLIAGDANGLQTFFPSRKRT